MKVVGLLSSKGPPNILVEIQKRLPQTTTEILYCHQTLPSFFRQRKLTDERSMLAEVAKYPPDTLFWFINTTSYKFNKACHYDWLALQLFFLFGRWQECVTRLLENYDCCGINLRRAPSIHFEDSCFWFKSTTPQNPYCLFSSYTNHYITPYPAKYYQNTPVNEAAPFSNLEISKHITDAFEGLLAAVIHNKTMFDFHPTLTVPRPAVKGYSKTLGFPHLTTQSEKYDIIVCSDEDVEEELKNLHPRGCILIRGKYTGPLPYQDISGNSLISL